MNILVINCGSSSLKFQLINAESEEVLAKGLCERIGIDGRLTYQPAGGEKEISEKAMPTHTEAIQFVIDALTNEKTGVVKSLSEIGAVGHRIVHGGEKFASSVVITEEVKKAVEECNDLAPLHNPANIMGVRAFMKALPNTIQVGVFDTAFHTTMEPTEYIYPVPYEWYEKYGVRKYGFHGTSHRYINKTISEYLKRDDLKVISCHIGNGGSISAVRDGKCVDTTMGFTPNAGIVMGSRSGDIDYGIIPYIMKKTGESIEEIDNDLNKKSGMFGVSGVSSDFRDIDAKIGEGHEASILAHHLYVNSIVGYVAKYFVELGSLDALCFTAGVGENASHIRRMVVDRLNCLGLKIDKEKNEEMRFGKEGIISSDDSICPIYVIPTDEEVVIARDTYKLI